MGITLKGTRVDLLPMKGREVAPGNFRMFAMGDPVPATGSFSWQDEGHLRFACPCGCGEVSVIRILRLGDASDGHGWAWDGNPDAPTLAPSIHRRQQCGWHGFLRAGIWETC